MPGPFTNSRAWFFVTDRCRLTCPHCAWECGPQGTWEMPLVRFEDWVTQALDLGFATVALMGGDPLCREDYPELLRIAGQAEQVVLLTSGMLTPRDRRVFRALDQGLRARLLARVSLDGPPAYHDGLRGAGNFERVVSGARFLRDLGVAVQCAVTELGQSPEELDAFGRIAEELGLPARRLPRIPVGRSAPDRACLSASRPRAGCEAFSSVAIDPHGHVYPCIQGVPDPSFRLGDLAQCSLEDVVLPSRRAGLLSHLTSVRCAHCPT